MGAEATKDSKIKEEKQRGSGSKQTQGSSRLGASS